MVWRGSWALLWALLFSHSLSWQVPNLLRAFLPPCGPRTLSPPTLSPRGAAPDQTAYPAGPGLPEPSMTPALGEPVYLLDR